MTIASSMYPPPRPPRDALEGKGPQGREGTRSLVESDYCPLQMPLKLALAVKETVAGHRLGALPGGGYHASLPPPPLIEATQKYGINAVPTPTVA